MYGIIEYNFNRTTMRLEEGLELEFETLDKVIYFMTNRYNGYTDIDKCCLTFVLYGREGAQKANVNDNLITIYFNLDRQYAGFSNFTYYAASDIEQLIHKCEQSFL